MALEIITAEQRMAEKRGHKMVICGQSGVGKTTLARTLDADTTLFIDLEAGDGMVYKGCERPHWRDPMPGLLETSLERAKGNINYSLYYHEIFFHYVLQDGQRAHYAWDRTR